jgi:hypothetical protein
MKKIAFNLFIKIGIDQSIEGTKRLVVGYNDESKEKFNVPS